MIYLDDDEDYDATFMTRGDYASEPCIFGDACLCPHVDHTSDECYTVEMAEQWTKEAEAYDSDAHVGSPDGFAAVPPTPGIVHDQHCCMSRGCHQVCSHLCGTDLAAKCCTAKNGANA